MKRLTNAGVRVDESVDDVRHPALCDVRLLAGKRPALYVRVQSVRRENSVTGQLLRQLNAPYRLAGAAVRAGGGLWITNKQAAS